MSVVEEIVAKIIATIVAKDLQPILEQDRARWNSNPCQHGKYT